MSLLNEQACFLADCWRLCEYIRSLGLTVTGGELYRTPEQQAIYVKSGKSKTSNSMHLQRCAIDLNIFVKPNGKFVLLADAATWQTIGQYWKSLSPTNRWGGEFKGFADLNHFERAV
jgi:hypothetical protein